MYLPCAPNDPAMTGIDDDKPPAILRIFGDGGALVCVVRIGGGVVRGETPGAIVLPMTSRKLVFSAQS